MTDTARMLAEKCENCIHFYEGGSGDGGECRAGIPSVPSPTHSGLWPQVAHHYSCGAFKCNVPRLVDKVVELKLSLNDLQYDYTAMEYEYESLVAKQEPNTNGRRPLATIQEE